MTRAHTILTALLTRAIEAGEVEVRSTQLYQDGRPVMPQLLFVADQEPPTSTAAAGIRRSAGGQHEENDSAIRKSRRFLRTGWTSRESDCGPGAHGPAAALGG
jgi:hypothetical protein